MLSVKNFVSEITDFEKGFFKTVIGLIKHSDKVVSDYLLGNTTWVRPLRFNLICCSLNSLISIVYFAIFKPYPDVPHWRLPVRITSFEQQFENFNEGFYALVSLIAIVPAAILFLKILYYRKSFAEIIAIALYSTGLFWLMWMLILPIPYYQLKDTIESIAAFIITYACFHRALGDRFYIGFPKWIALAFALFSFYSYIFAPLVQFTFAKVMVSSANAVATPVPDVAKADALHTYDLKEALQLVSVEHDDRSRTLVIGDYEGVISITCFNKELEKEWIINPININTVKSASSLVLAGHKELMIVSANDKQGNGVVLILDHKGKILAAKVFDDIIINSCILVSRDVIAAVGGNHIKNKSNPYIELIAIDFLPDTVVLRTHNRFDLPGISQRFKDAYYGKQDSSDRINLMLTKYENSLGGLDDALTTELSQLAVTNVTLDTTYHVQWEKIVFQKTTRYSPRLDFFIAEPLPSGESIISYCISDDMEMSSRLFCIDNQGHTKWNEELREGDVTAIYDFDIVGSSIYFTGRIATAIPRTAFLSNFNLGFAGVVDTNGDGLSLIRYGERRSFSNNKFRRIETSGSSVDILNEYEEGTPFTYRNTLERLRFPKEVLRSRHVRN